MKRLMIAIRISKNMKESRAISLALSLFLGNSVRFQNCLELPEDMFLRLLKQRRRKQLKSLILSILHRPKIKV